MKLSQLFEASNPSKDDLEAYAFALDWHKDHRKIKRRRIEYLAKLFPFSGVAYRVSADNKFGSMTSWSKSKEALKTYSMATPQKEKIQGLDLEALCRHVLTLDKTNIDLHDMIDVREVIKL